MKNKDIKSKIIEYFFLNPTTKLRVRQIEREVGVPLPSVIDYTKKLEEEGILKNEIIASVRLYSANRSSNNFLLKKKLFNIYSLHFSGLMDHIINEYSNPTIIVFGSYASGEDTEKSDIDIYIETSKKELSDFSCFEKKLKRKLHILKYKSIKMVENKELANNILNGIVLNGFIEVFK